MSDLGRHAVHGTRIDTTHVVRIRGRVGVGLGGGGVAGGVVVARVAVLGVLGRRRLGGRAHARLLGGVAIAHLVRVRVLGQRVCVAAESRVRLAPAEQAQETTLLGVARGVVVARAGAESLLLEPVAGQGYLEKSGEDEEEAEPRWNC